jgi:hypothetical protein
LLHLRTEEIVRGIETLLQADRRESRGSQDK